MSEFSESSDSEAADEEHTFKVVLLGHTAAGKTALVMRLIHDVFAERCVTSADRLDSQSWNAGHHVSSTCACAGQSRQTAWTSTSSALPCPAVSQ